MSVIFNGFSRCFIMPYSAQNLQDAIDAVKSNTFSMRKASRIYNVPFSTIRNHCKGVSDGDKRGPKPKLKDYEGEIKEACDTLVAMGVGLSRTGVKTLASDVCEKAELPPFKNNIPSQKWFLNFKKRNNLSMRKPQNISAARLAMSTEEVKTEFFTTLKKVYDELIPKGLDGTTIYNSDEFGMCTVLPSGKVVCTTGTHFVRAKKGGERGQNVSGLATVNATGSVILPPMVIFRGKHLSEEQMRDAMEGTIFAYSPKSFIDAELFQKWMVRFAEMIPPKRPVLLLLDGHGSHINMTVLDLASANGITMLCLPPHTTHLYQPLDRCVFAALKKQLSHESDKRIRRYKKKNLNKNDICQILKPAWEKAVTPANIIAGFRCSGIWPYNPDAVNLGPTTAGWLVLAFLFFSLWMQIYM